MADLNEAKTKVAATYNAASGLFDHPANAFWDRFGRNRLFLPNTFEQSIVPAKEFFLDKARQLTHD